MCAVVQPIIRVNFVRMAFSSGEDDARSGACDLSETWNFPVSPFLCEAKRIFLQVFPHLVATIGAFVESASASPEFTAATGSMTAAMTLESVSDVLATCNPPTVRLGLGADIHTAVRCVIVPQS